MPANVTDCSATARSMLVQSFGGIPMELEKLGDCAGITTAHPTFSAYTKVIDRGFGSFNAFACSIDAVG